MSEPVLVKTQVNTLVISVLRTVVPALWGSLFGFLVLQVPGLEQVKNEFAAFGEVVTVVLIGLWYFLARKAEPYLPTWLRALAMGFPASPAVYAPKPADVVVVDVAVDGGEVKSIPVPGNDGVALTQKST